MSGTPKPASGWIPPWPDVDFNPAKGLLKMLSAIKKPTPRAVRRKHR